MSTPSTSDSAAAFFAAIRAGDASQVRTMLSANPKLSEARNQEGATAVLWAIYTGHHDLALEILGRREPDLFEAAALGQTESVARFLRRDPAFANAFSQDGFGVLGLAVYFGHLETARLLVESGADVNAPSRNTLHVAPLQSAVASGRIELVDFLLNDGADPKAIEGREYREALDRLRASARDPGQTT